MSAIEAMVQTHWDADELVGVTEIAERRGTSTGTIRQWRYRHSDFPQPVATLSMGPVWRWGDVASWLQSRGRRT